MGSRHKWWIHALRVAFLLGGTLLVISPSTSQLKAHGPGTVQTLPQATPFQPMLPLPSSLHPQRLLVIVPHPDDESLGGTAMIRRTLTDGGQVKIAVMTNGDGFRKAAARTFGVRKPGPQELYKLGQLRQQEELQAAQQLGLHREDIFFLGYPDAGMHRLWLNHWNVKTPYRSLNGFQYVPYAMSYHRTAPYCGQAVVGDLSRLMSDFQPTDVLYPDPLDVHRDHWATSAFTQYVIAGLEQSPREWTYLVHYPDFPIPRLFSPQRPLLHPQRLANVGNSWLSMPLSLDGMKQKHRAILSHHSQIQVMKNLLESFVRPNDLIGTHDVPTIQTRAAGTDPFAATGALPFTILQDPLHDEKQQSADAADIWQVAAVLSGDRLQVCVEFAEEVKQPLQYGLRLRLPVTSETRMSRLDLHLRNGLITSEQYPYRDDLVNKQSTYTWQGRRLLFTLPSSFLAHNRSILLSAEVSDGHMTLDQTPWRRFQLPFQYR